MTTTLPGGVLAAGLTNGSEATPGTMPAWAVTFSVDGPAGPEPRLTVGSDAYDGSVSATLPSDLEGGRYEVVIEGLSDAHYQRIRVAAGTRLTAAIHLWWRDTPAGVWGDLARAAGLGDLIGSGVANPPDRSLVAVIRVDALRRQAGERRYDTVVSGRERVWARLRESAIRGDLCYASLDVAAREIARQAGFDVQPHGLKDLTPAAETTGFADVRPGNALQAMQTIRDQAAAALGRQRLTAVIRDGVLHVGLWTARAGGVEPLPVVRQLDMTTGLLGVQRATDDDAAAEPGPRPPAPRARVTATALGRPDIKPGDVIQIPLPPTDYPTLEPSGPSFPLLCDLQSSTDAPDEPADPSSCLVNQVSHRFSRRQGFVTTVEAVVLRSGADDGWDPVATGSTGDPGLTRLQRGSRPADHATGAAGAVAEVAKAVAQRTPGVRLRAGQIRAHTGSPTDPNSSEVWYATAPPDGQPDLLRRVAITPSQHAKLPAVPVVTPFAFGGYGLVLPRYPGSRVLLADSGGGRDVVDLGGLWETGVAPPAKPGDWWLLLPISGSTDDLEPETEASPPSTGDASHDLIDADGRRLIEVAGLTLRVVDTPTTSGTRPDPGEVGAVVIENTKEGRTARIEIKDDGSITITATSISLNAGAGDITLKAANVKVAVTGTMDVSG